MEEVAAVAAATPRDVQLEREAGVLRSFASFLSTSQHQNRAPQQAQKEEEVGPLSRLFQVLDEDPEACCCAVPCLQLSSIGSISSTFTGSSSSRSSLEEVSAESLARLIRVDTRDDLTNLPSRLLTNCLGSFRKLLEARCKQTIQALLGGTSNSSQPASCSEESALVARLLAKLAIRTPESAQIHFRTLEFAERCSAPANVSDERHETTNSMGSRSSSSTTHVVVPVVLEFVMEWTLWDDTTRIAVEPIEAPGVLQGNFDTTTSSNAVLLRAIRMELDTRGLFQSMVQQAKLLVRKVLVAATCLVKQTQQEEASSLSNMTAAAAWNPTLSSDAVLRLDASTLPRGGEESRHIVAGKQQDRDRTSHDDDDDGMMPPPPKRAPSGEGFSSPHRMIYGATTPTTTTQGNVLLNASLPIAAAPVHGAAPAVISRRDNNNADSAPALALLSKVIQDIEEN